MFGPTLALVGAGRSNAGRPKLPIRLMASLLYLKHSFNLTDEELVTLEREHRLAVFQRHGVAPKVKMSDARTFSLELAVPTKYDETIKKRGEQRCRAGGKSAAELNLA